MGLIRLYRLVEGTGSSGQTSRFFLLADIFVPGREFIRHRLVRVTGDWRFLARSIGLDPKSLKKAGRGWRPEGPEVQTTSAWSVSGADGSSGSIFEIEMPATATGIRTGTMPGYRDPFELNRDYDTDQVDVGTGSGSQSVVSYPVGPGLDPPSGIRPKPQAIANVDLETE